MNGFERHQSGVDLVLLAEQFSAMAGLLLIELERWSTTSDVRREGGGVVASACDTLKRVVDLPVLVHADIPSIPAVRLHVEALAVVANDLAEILATDCERGKRIVLGPSETAESVILASEIVSLAARIILVLARRRNASARLACAISACLAVASHWATYEIAAFLAVAATHPGLSPLPALVLPVACWARRPGQHSSIGAVVLVLTAVVLPHLMYMAAVATGLVTSTSVAWMPPATNRARPTQGRVPRQPRSRTRTPRGR